MERHCGDDDGSVLVAYAFGRRTGPRDPVNEHLAACVAAEVAATRRLVVVTQHDLARRLPALPGDVRVEVCEDHLPAGRYVNTGSICLLARALAGGGPVRVVAHALHLPRVLATHRALGLPATPAGPAPRLLDRRSEQWWTRSRPAWWAWQAAAWPKVAVLAGRAEGGRKLH